MFTQTRCGLGLGFGFALGLGLGLGLGVGVGVGGTRTAPVRHPWRPAVPAALSACRTPSVLPPYSLRAGVGRGFRPARRPLLHGERRHVAPPVRAQRRRRLSECSEWPEWPCLLRAGRGERGHAHTPQLAAPLCWIGRSGACSVSVQTCWLVISSSFKGARADFRWQNVSRPFSWGPSWPWRHALRPLPPAIRT